MLSSAPTTPVVSSNSIAAPFTTGANITTTASSSSTNTSPTIATTPTLTTTTTTTTNCTNSNINSEVNGITNNSTINNSTQTDDLIKQISKNFNHEISELRGEIKKLREDFEGFSDLKNIIEVMSKDLKACQSATENQRRYIKDLVNNLADERKRIAAMQDEIDRNLK